jgi:hypothetical protein
MQSSIQQHSGRLQQPQCSSYPERRASRSFDSEEQKQTQVQLAAVHHPGANDGAAAAILSRTTSTLTRARTSIDSVLIIL